MATTPNLGLTQPAVDSTGWGGDVNTNFGTLDTNIPLSNFSAVAAPTVNDDDTGTTGIDKYAVGSRWFDTTAENEKAYICLDASAGAAVWKETTAQGDVTSVFGRSGAVVALPSDYDASQVDNDSDVDGDFVSDALDNLDEDKEDSLTFGTGLTRTVDTIVTNDSQIVHDNLDSPCTIASHDTSATGAELDTLTGDLMADALHRHSELSASDGSPNPALQVDSNGQVGIGTTSPNYLLDVNSNIGLIEDSAINWHDGSGNNSAQIYGDSSDNLIFRNTSSNTERMRIDSSGMVGFATSSPLIPLQLNNYGGFDGDGNQIHISNNAYYDTGDTRIERIKSGYATQVSLVNLDGSIRFKTATTGAADSAVTFNERMRIIESGNVGIGTSSPSSLLHIAAAIPKFTIQGTGTAIAYQEIANDGGDFWIGKERYSGGGLLAGSSAYAGVVLTRSAHSLEFGTNSLLRMAIDSSGHIFFNNLNTMSGKADVQYDTSTKELGYVSSAIKYKTKVKDAKANDTDFIFALKPRLYDHKKTGRKNEIGLIAEEVELIKPDIIGKILNKKTNELETETYSRTELIVPLLHQVQIMKQTIDNQNKQIESLESRLSTLEN
jgi:hypothetical protein